MSTTTTTTPVLGTLRACRWTVPCPIGQCPGSVVSPRGSASWKRGDFPSATGGSTASVVSHCSECKNRVSVPRP